jgi:lysophospholipase L1-like esterase
MQFGHNGQPGKGEYRETNPEGSYRDYLRRFVAEIRAAGAEPIIVSSLTRRHFDEAGRIVSTLGPWAEGAHAVADELDILFIDLHATSIACHNGLGRERSAAFDLEPGDQTHLSPYGAGVIADLILEALRDAGHPLVRDAAAAGTATNERLEDEPCPISQ